MSEHCPHITLSPDAVAVIAPIRGARRVECPCCHLPGQIDGPEPPLAGMRCPYCDVQAVLAEAGS